MTKDLIYSEKRKDSAIAFLLWFFLGMFGGHLFYFEKKGKAITYLLCSLFGFILLGIPNLIILVMFIIDLFNIKKETSIYNEQLRKIIYKDNNNDN